MERFFLSLKTERVWQRDYANTPRPRLTSLTTSWASTTACDCIQNWATCHPMLSSSNRQLNNLSLCPKKLDQHRVP